jgi:hypothetical protein
MTTSKEKQISGLANDALIEIDLICRRPGQALNVATLLTMRA